VGTRMAGAKPGAGEPEGGSHLRRRAPFPSCDPTRMSCCSARSATTRPEIAIGRRRPPLVLSGTSAPTPCSSAIPAALTEMEIRPFPGRIGARLRVASGSPAACAIGANGPTPRGDRDRGAGLLDGPACIGSCSLPAHRVSGLFKHGISRTNRDPRDHGRRRDRTSPYRRASSAEIKRRSPYDPRGMLTLRQDGWSKAEWDRPRSRKSCTRSWQAAEKGRTAGEC
jgi:hypothetical protein